MPVNSPLRLAAAVALGLGATAAMWLRAAPIEPFLEVRPVRQVKSPNFDLWGIGVTARGGETIEEVRVEIVSGAVSAVGDLTFKGLKAGWSKGFRVQVADPATSRGVLRVVQSGRIERTYEVVLEDER